MRYPRKWQLAAVCLLALSLLPLAPSPSGRAQSGGYTVTDIGTLGGTRSAGYGVDPCGRVVGESFPLNSTSNHPFLWSGAAITDLGTFGGPSGTASAINTAGAVVGTARDGEGRDWPFFWTPVDGKVNLGTLGGSFASAFDLNDSNDVIGTSETETLEQRGFAWRPNTTIQTLSGSGGTVTAANGINNAGKVVGAAQFASGSHGFLFSGGALTDLGTLGGTQSFAREINEAGDRVVGYSDIAGDSTFHAFLYKTGTASMQDLGTLGGFSIAHDVNNSEQVVGASETTPGGGTHAFLWASAGGIKDLNVLVPGTGWTFIEARSINDSGQITGTGVNPSGQTHAFLLTPTGATPPPCPNSPGVIQFSAPSYSVSENVDGGTINITVNRVNGSDGAVSVNYAVTDGTATAGSDYTVTSPASASGTFNFAAGETTKTITIAVNNDATFEADETVNLKLSSAVGGAQLSSVQSEVTLTITNDDPAPSFSVADVTLTEGNSGTTAFDFKVGRTGSTALASSVNFSTADGTAVAPSDYTAASGTLNFAPGETEKTVTVLVNGDATAETNETFFVNLSGATNATITDSQAQGTVVNDDAAPSFSVGDVTLAEGNAGTTAFSFTVTKSGATALASSVNFATADGTAQDDSPASEDNDYTPTSGTLNFAAGEATKTVTVLVNGDAAAEPDETFFVNLSGASGATITDAQAQGTVTNDDNSPTLRFSQLSIPAAEASHFVTVTVTRSGNASAPVSVDYATSDITALDRRDYTTALGTLRFAANEVSKSFDVLLTDDVYQESSETFNITLTNPAGGAVTTNQSSAVVVIADNDTAPAPNPIDNAQFFVRQHYHDFLNREPDADGLAHWTGQMTNCGDPNLEVCRINVSAAFFLSIEFKETGYLVERMYKVAYGDAVGIKSTPEGPVQIPVPVIRRSEFIADGRALGDGVVVGAPGWPDVLENNKNALALAFVQRDRFRSQHSQNPTTFVDQLNTAAGLVLTDAERTALINELTANNTDAGRASVFRKVAENAELERRERNRAFVLMQYFGYLQRDPDALPDTNHTGFQFWLDKLNEFNGNFVQAEMVKAFLDSIEYRQRFAP